MVIIPSRQLTVIFQRSEDQSGAMMDLQRELDDTRAMLKRDRERESRRQGDDEKEIRKLKEKVERLEKEKSQMADQAVRADSINARRRYIEPPYRKAASLWKSFGLTSKICSKISRSSHPRTTSLQPKRMQILPQLLNLRPN